MLVIIRRPSTTSWDTTYLFLCAQGVLYGLTVVCETKWDETKWKWTDFHFANYRFSFRKLQIFVSQTTDSHFANYRFSFRKLQILISQTTDFHFANYRFPFRFVPFRFANYNKPFICACPSFLGLCLPKSTKNIRIQVQINSCLNHNGKEGVYGPKK